MPSCESARQVLSPSQVSGTLTATLSAIAASLRPSASIVSASVAATSALTGPSTRAANLAHGLDEVPSRFGDERWVRGDAVEQARGGKLADFGDFRGVGEEFHGVPSFFLTAHFGSRTK